jgi:hypothetical protein
VGEDVWCVPVVSQFGQMNEPRVVECADIYAAAPDDERSDGRFVVLGADRQRGEG